MISASSTNERILTQINQDLLDLSEDPLSNALDLLFLLESNVDSPQVAQLIEWSNSWLIKILVQKEISRYADRDFTSALICRFALRRAKKLREKIPLETLKERFDHFLDGNSFFDSFGFTALIVMSLHQDIAGHESYDRVVSWLREEIRQRLVFSDSKNIVFACLFLETVDDEAILSDLVDYAVWSMEQAAVVSTYDKLYLAWTIWRQRTRVKRIDAATLRTAVQSVLQNSNILQQEEAYVDPTLQELYGSPMTYRPSRLALIILFDLNRSFYDNTVTLAREELSHVGRLARVGSIISLGEFLLAAILAYYSYALGWLGVSEFVSSPSGVQIAITHILLLTSIVFLLVTGMSLFYDTLVKPTTIDRIIIMDLKSRLVRYMKEILIAIAASTLMLLAVGR